MRIKKQIQTLLENGIKPETIKNWDIKQIKVLSELFAKTETKEAVVKTTIPPGEKITADLADVQKAGLNIDGTNITMKDGKIIARKGGDKTEGEMTEDETINVVNDPDATADGMPTEGEMNERFESKAQQGLFWARCKNSKGKTKEKWCKMAKEFSDSTSKKEYKDMPEKKHPEKTVKRKTTKESYEKFLENRIVNMLDNHINPSMTKDRLIQSIVERKNSESFMLKNPKRNSMFSQDEGKEMKTMKRPIGRMFSMGAEMTEDTKEKTRTKPDTDTDKKEKGKDKDRKNPFEPKHRPAPKARKGEYKEQATAPARPKTKPDTDTDKKEKDKGRKNPFEPKHRPKPKAGGEKEIPTWLNWNKLGVKLK